MGKYLKGEKILSLHTAIDQEYLYFCHKIYHKGWFMNWSLAWLENQIKHGTIYKAISAQNKNIWIDEFKKINSTSLFMEKTTR